MEFEAIFQGKKRIFVGKFKLEHGNLYYLKKNKLFPFLSKWVIAIFNARKELMEDYEVSRIIDFDEGITTREVRIYPIDFYTKEKDISKIDSESKLERNSLQAEVDYLHQELQEMKMYIEEQGMFDLYLARHKKVHNSIMALKSGVNVSSEDTKKGN